MGDAIGWPGQSANIVWTEKATLEVPVLGKLNGKVIWGLEVALSSYTGGAVTGDVEWKYLLLSNEWNPQVGGIVPYATSAPGQMNCAFDPDNTSDAPKR
jgi:hypothetical protein